MSCTRKCTAGKKPLVFPSNRNARGKDCLPRRRRKRERISRFLGLLRLFTAYITFAFNQYGWLLSPVFHSYQVSPSRTMSSLRR